MLPAGSDPIDDQGKLLAHIEEVLTAQLDLIAQSDAEGILRLTDKLSGLLKALDSTGVAPAHAARWERVRSLYHLVTISLACERDKVRKDLARLTQSRGKVAAYLKA
jgi:hypothetical protein